MRANSATGGREADHEIVEPRVRQEIEAVQQLIGLGQQMIDAGYQQAPVALGQLLQGFGLERSVFEQTLAALKTHQAAFGVVAARELAQTPAVQPVAESGQGLAYQQRLFLPVFGQEVFRSDPAEKSGEREIGHPETVGSGMPGIGFHGFDHGIPHIMLSIYPEEC